MRMSFLRLGRVDPDKQSGALWTNAARDSHVSFDERRESQTRRSFARALAEALARERQSKTFRSLTSPTAFMRRRGSRRCLRHLLENLCGSGLGDKASQPGALELKRLRRFLMKNCGPRTCSLKERLVAFIRHRSAQSRIAAGERADYIEAANTMFDPAALTIGFARRVAGYKRWNLLLTDPQRLLRLINNEERPVQFVFAGKAHPQDEGSKLVLQQLAQWKYDPAVRQRAVFLEDYDQEIARQLVQSVDVWLNVPRRPQEASGTSGEKVAINGGLNLSILDGWWLEGYDGTNGFAIGNGNDSARRR